MKRKTKITPPKTRARLLILNQLLSFPTVSNKDWGYNCGCDKAMIGDLVSLQFAPPSKWQISWLLDIDTLKGDLRYLLESIDDGSLGWWTNVGLTVYNREIVNKCPSWKWTDRQFAFNDRWKKVCKKNDAYIVLPCNPVFNEDDSVLLDVHIRFNFSDFHNPHTFPYWKLLTMKEMDAYYKECVEKYEAQRGSL